MTRIFVIETLQDVKIEKVNSAWKLKIIGKESGQGPRQEFQLDLATSYITTSISLNALNQLEVTANINTQTPVAGAYDTYLQATGSTAVYSVQYNVAGKAQLSVVIDDHTVYFQGQTHSYALDQQTVTLHIEQVQGSTYKHEIYSNTTI